MNEFKDELIKDINNIYDNVDFSILPICVQEAYDRRTFYDLIFLLKISDFLDYYTDFKKTRDQKTSMNVKILDFSDMIAYMKLNSDIKIPKTDDIRISREMIKRLYSSKMGEMILMFDKHVEKINMLSDMFLEIKEEEFNKYKHKLQVINKFIHKLKQPPKESFEVFVSWSETKRTSIERLFKKLKFEERFIIADTIINNGEHEINSDNPDLILVCKLILGDKLELSSDVIKKHIMLRFIYYRQNSDYIVESIVENIIFFSDISPDNHEQRINTAAKVISSIHADIQTKEIVKNLTEKCLKRIESVRRSTMTLLQRI